MKKSVLILIAAVFSTATVFVGCKPSTKEELAAQENVQEAKQEVKDAKEDLAEAKRQANAAEWQRFKNDMETEIDKNDAKIAALKQEVKKTGKAADAEYERKVDALKEKNDELKLKIETYKNDADSDWESFQREFNHDKDELGKALKDLTIDNKK
jgi:hypothetical protein